MSIATLYSRPCTLHLQAFLEANHLKLIIRSHEGPDARWKREGMQDMSKGHSLDHVTPGRILLHMLHAQALTVLHW